LRIDHNIAPLTDVLVRRALSFAIDREAFVGSLGFLTAPCSPQRYFR
jgi:ABC-type oligopeptide transport system substrate-binding subunit